MSKNLEKLQALLAEMFQFENADLDFGIYRIMNSKRDEISRFLNGDLLPQVKKAFESYQSADKSGAEAELKEAILQAEKLGFANPLEAPLVKQLQEKLKASVDVKALEEEVYSHLTNFFRRYYQEGDFISLRRYKEGVYAIPYEGEEVKLHWANHDQYYVKTTEYFKDYTFKTTSGKRVHFKLVDADTERDNIKEESGKERRFILNGDQPYLLENGELILRFEYRPDPEKRKQADLIQAALGTVLGLAELKEWLPEITEARPTEKNKTRTLLEKHLVDYTARNTFDYFIHKNLGGFLRRELDFYIKNEVMHLDDIQEETAPKVEEYLSKIKVIRQIAHKIIEFLAQIENFQKKLWLKKKFVVETNYCITLDRIPEEFYPEIAANDAQREEWVRLYSLDSITPDLSSRGSVYTAPLTVDFLCAHRFLACDTQYFPLAFKEAVLSCIDNVDDSSNGLLCNSDNFHSLRLLSNTYNNRIDTVYADPPYNSTASVILYKNDYLHSSWMSLLESRMQAVRRLMTNRGIICVTIDDNEVERLIFVMQDAFEGNHLGTAIVRNNPQGRSTVKGFAVNHEFALFYAKSDELRTVGRLDRTAEQIGRYDEIDENGLAFLWENFRKTGTDSGHADRPKQFYPIYLQEKSIRIPAARWNDLDGKWEILDPPTKSERVILPIDDNDIERVWKWGIERARNFITHLKVEFDAEGTPQLYRRNYLNTEGSLPGTWWDKAKYAAGSHGTNLLSDMFGTNHVFAFPKSVFAVEDCLKVAGISSANIVIDFFAGSGTTGHSIINLLRSEKSSAKYVLLEMGTYFSTILKPRIIKAAFASKWEDGKPVTRDGISHMFKYIRLESYEDALNNIELKRTEAQQSLLDNSAEFKESYMLSYLLDEESKGSPSLLNIDAFEDPFNYKLKVSAGSVGESKLVNVDLVETFNFLIGLTVRHIDWIKGCCVVEGANRNNDKVLVIWRNVKETPNEELETFFNTLDIRTKDQEFDLIYVNGDNNLENIRREDETWKVRMIEEDFFRLMFDVEDI